MSLVEMRSVVKSYNKARALDGLTLNLEECGQYAIQGPSGSGKSTLLYLMGGLDRPSSGSITVDGKNLAALGDEELAGYRNRFVGFVFQFHFLLPSMNCLKNILLPAKIAAEETSRLKKSITSFAAHLGVKHCLKKYPFELSGGEQQRINIIRALVLRPKLLLCDEPTGNLDSENSARVIGLLRDLAGEFAATLVVVTHDLQIARQFKQRVVMRDGRISPSGEGGEVSPIVIFENC